MGWRSPKISLIVPIVSKIKVKSQRSCLDYTSLRIMDIQHMEPIHSFAAGDFLIFQLESGYALLRVLDVSGGGAETVWHLAAYKDFFLDPDTADLAIESLQALQVD